MIFVSLLVSDKYKRYLVKECVCVCVCVVQSTGYLLKKKCKTEVFRTETIHSTSISCYCSTQGTITKVIQASLSPVLGQLNLVCILTIQIHIQVSTFNNAVDYSKTVEHNW